MQRRTPRGGTWSAGVAERTRHARVRHAVRVFTFCATAILVGMALGYLFIDRVVPNLSNNVYNRLYSVITALYDLIKKLH